MTCANTSHDKEGLPSFLINDQRRLKTAPTDYFTEVSLGNIDGHSIFNMSGANPDVSTTAPENLWQFGGRMVYPTTGEQLELASTSVNDSIGGTGAQMVLLSYLDTDYIEQSEIIATSGTTPVLTVAINIYRVISAVVVQVGSAGYNDGDLSIVNGGNPRIGIVAGSNVSSQGFYTIPAGYTGYFIYGYSAIGKNKDAEVHIFTTYGDDGIFVRNAFSDLYQNSIEFTPVAPIGGFIEKTDLQFVCGTLSNKSKTSAFMQLLLVENRV